MSRIRAVFLAVLTCLLVTGPVAAAKPLMERVPINDVGLHDEFLSDACGFDIWFDGTGHITFRVWLDEAGDPVRELNNYAVRIRYFSESGWVRTVDVGADRATYHADGSFTLTIIGNVTPLHVPGSGLVYADVGQVTLHFTFPEDPEEPPSIEILKSAGMHSEIPFDAVICDILG